MKAAMSLFGRAPTILSTTCPFLKRNSAGMEVTPSWAAKGWLVSTSTLQILTEPDISVASWSKTGPNCLQGPHHVAQKSTSTGTVADLMVDSNVVASRLSMRSEAIKIIP